jgi:hypothetical protein
MAEAVVKSHGASFKGEEIQRIRIGINALEKFCQVVVMNAFWESFNSQFGIDGESHFFHDFNFGASDGFHRSSGLAIEILNAKAIHVRNMESTNSEASQCEKMAAPDSTKTCNRDRFVF